MGMYGPHTDTFTRREYEEFQLRIIELEQALIDGGVDIPGGPTRMKPLYMNRDPRGDGYKAPAIEKTKEQSRLQSLPFSMEVKEL